MQCSISPNKSHDICRRDSSTPESGWISLFHLTYVHGFRHPVHIKMATAKQLKPFVASFSHFDSWHLSCNRSAAGTSNVTYDFTVSHMVINNNQECQRNPTLAISNSRYNNSNIRTLIHINMEERTNSSIQYSVPYKQPVWLYVSVEKTMLLQCLKMLWRTCRDDWLIESKSKMTRSLYTCCEP
jgi:hypothetical protein